MNPMKSNNNLIPLTNIVYLNPNFCPLSSKKLLRRLHRVTYRWKQSQKKTLLPPIRVAVTENYSAEVI